eukprot:scaffold24593_cov112-Isochrysis_galbana.AAC.1
MGITLNEQPAGHSNGRRSRGTLICRSSTRHVSDPEGRYMTRHGPADRHGAASWLHPSAMLAELVAHASGGVRMRSAVVPVKNGPTSADGAEPPARLKAMSRKRYAWAESSWPSSTLVPVRERLVGRATIRAPVGQVQLERVAGIARRQRRLDGRIGGAGWRDGCHLYRSAPRTETEAVACGHPKRVRLAGREAVHLEGWGGDNQPLRLVAGHAVVCRGIDPGHRIVERPGGWRVGRRLPAQAERGARGAAGMHSGGGIQEPKRRRRRRHRQVGAAACIEQLLHLRAPCRRRVGCTTHPALAEMAHHVAACPAQAARPDAHLGGAVAGVFRVGVHHQPELSRVAQPRANRAARLRRLHQRHPVLAPREYVNGGAAEGVAELVAEDVPLAVPLLRDGPATLV